MGVWANRVTSCSTSRSSESSGTRATAGGTTTSRLPCSSAPHNSHTETSKAYEWNSATTSVSSVA